MSVNNQSAMRVILAAFAMGALSPPAAAADPFGSVLKGIVPGVPSASKPKPDQASPGASGAMNMNESTPVPPLHGLGTDAVAMVEDASKTAAVQPMDYVFAKQAFDLGKTGEVTLGFLSGCRTEKIKGGAVTVALDGSAVAGGQLTASETPNCKAPKPIILASQSEAGATVNRITPFSGANWNERTLKSTEPLFKWDNALGAVKVRVRDMEKEGEPVIWEAPADKGWIAYAANAEKLEAGKPYKVEAVVGDKVSAGALFSIDSSLDVADNMANRLVPLAAP